MVRSRRLGAALPDEPPRKELPFDRGARKEAPRPELQMLDDPGVEIVGRADQNAALHRDIARLYAIEPQHGVNVDQIATQHVELMLGIDDLPSEGSPALA
jgi:hypothetical protein